ncbi:MAG: hypothetical protein KC912_24420 [Proteobacteria bacterium]|nr:hypothetical protein [Pseudomonadota bacterium]
MRLPHLALVAALLVPQLALAAPIAVDAPADTAAADAVAAELKGSQFPSKLRRAKENAPIFLALAARDTANAPLAAAALEGMAATWTDREGRDKPQADAAYATVVSAYLDHSNPLVLAQALKAAKHVLKQGHEEVIGKVAALAGGDMAKHYAALEALVDVPDWGKRDDLAGVFAKALEAEPAVASLALFRLESRAFSFALRDEVSAATQGLLTHADPGVRGRAALAHVRYNTDAVAAAAAVEPLLDDSDAFVRSAAARAVGSAGALRLTDKLMSMLGDSAKSTYDITGWTQLNGKAGRVHHDGSAWSRVDDAALQGLKSLGGRNGSERLTLTRVRYDHIDEDLATCVSEARAWHAANRDALK